uniref:DUF148 domain-containing protein n=1 Tax=Elaeophora elaphi TaxID=1147741 RepID=A0A0R3S1D3_9BILA
MKMNGNCAMELLLVLSVVICPLLGSDVSNCESWSEQRFPAFIPKIWEIREEYCELRDRHDLSKNELNDELRKWAAKYNLLDEFEEDLLKKILYDAMFYEVFQEKLRDSDESDENQALLLEMVKLKYTEYNTPIEELNNQVDEMLPEEDMIHFIFAWIVLDLQTDDEVKRRLPMFNNTSQVNTIEYTDVENMIDEELNGAELDANRLIAMLNSSDEVTYYDVYVEGDENKRSGRKVGCLEETEDDEITKMESSETAVMKSADDCR